MNILEKINNYLNELDIKKYLDDKEEERLERRKKYQREYIQKRRNDPAFVSYETQRKLDWFARNPGKRKESRKRYFEKHKEDVEKWAKDYYSKNKETHNRMLNYGPRENSIILKKEKSDPEIAKELGRTVWGIVGQRKRLMQILSPKERAELMK